MKHRGSKLIVLILIWALIAVAGFGSAIWQLWNRLMPGLFGLPVIGFWQAVGLMALSWLLFGGWRGAGGLRSRRHRGGRGDGRHLLTDEERAHLRASMARDCP
ncbi:hypothetical protein [Massilia phyllosphaerae]|uniref:hypothetical protein n=1 Tax=Massilia phyllosphaerae TaxID=3106034 RepID=UPI002B1CABC5|nr:hypothetical protein [Massilia sp. SGZ-792]